MTTSTWGGAVRQDPGDYVYAVDANVAPASKYSLVVTRSTNLDVKIDQVGNALNTLQLSWQNDSTKQGEPYASLRQPTYSTSPTGIYGTYVRVLTPDRSRLKDVSGGALDPITAPEAVTQEAGRTVFANYLMVPPGTATLTYQWTSPYPASAGGQRRDCTAWSSRSNLDMLSEPITLHISVPSGATITAASPNLHVSGNVATFTGSLTQDLTFAIQYSAE